MKKYFMLLPGLVAAVLLPACSLLSPIDNQQKEYILGQVPAVRTQTNKHLRLVVSRPVTAAIYDTPQMAYFPRKWEVSYFAKNRWGSRPADMIQNLLIRTFEASHVFVAVSKTRGSGRSELILSSELMSFEEDLTGPAPVFRVVLRAELQDNNGHRLAAHRFSASQPLTMKTPYGMVIAANQAVADVLREIERFFIHKMHTKGPKK